MVRRVGFIAVVLLLIAAVSFSYLKISKDKENLLSAEYVYANIFLITNGLILEKYEETYGSADLAKFKTNYAFSHIDLITMKEDVVRCLLDNGISYERTEDPDLEIACGKTFVEKITSQALSLSLNDDNLAQALIAHTLAQYPQKAKTSLEEEGFSEGGIYMAPIIAYTRLNVYECVKTATNEFLNSDEEQNKPTISDVLDNCHKEYLGLVQEVVKDYEYSKTN